MKELTREIILRIITEQQAQVYRAKTAVVAPVTQAAPVIAPPTQENIAGTINSVQYDTYSLDSFKAPQNGVLRVLEGNGNVREMRIKTPTQFANFDVYIDGVLFIKGNFAMVEDQGMAYYEPHDDTYVVQMFGIKFSRSFSASIDPGIAVTQFLLTYAIPSPT